MSSDNAATVEDAKTSATSRVLVLVATIVPRLRSCERLLAELERQSRRPDAVLLVLDGYDKELAPRCALPVTELRSKHRLGAGSRWRVANDLPPNDIILNLDDDIMLQQAPRLIQALVTAVEQGGGAAAAMGRSANGKQAPPGTTSRGPLIYGGGCGLAVRAGHLKGLQELRAEVRAKGGFDPLGLLGDDDALLSAHLWKQGIPIHHAATGNIFSAPGTRNNSQSAARAAKRESPTAQKEAIRRITGWPWPQVAIAKSESNTVKSVGGRR